MTTTQLSNTEILVIINKVGSALLAPSATRTEETLEAVRYLRKAYDIIVQLEIDTALGLVTQ